MQSLLVNEALWTLTNTLLRISACCFLRQIFWIVRSFRVTSSIVVCVCVIHGIISALELFLICRPLAAQWDAYGAGTCGNQIDSFMVIECCGLVLDCIISILPIPLIYGMSI